MSWVLMALGVAQVTVGIVRGGAVLPLLLGALFIGAGAARLWLLRLRRR